jgi:hypothetical protein
MGRDSREWMQARGDSDQDDICDIGQSNINWDAGLLNGELDSPDAG